MRFIFNIRIARMWGMILILMEKKTQIVFSCDLTGYKRVLVKYTVQYDAHSAFDLFAFKRSQNRCPHLIISTFQSYCVQR